MKIWLVTIGEPIITINQKLRLHRTGILAKYISENSNHEITWFTSTFNHFLKYHEYESDNEYRYNKNLKIISFKGIGYKSNISISRIIDHRIIAKKFDRYIKKIPKPDIIISSFPTMDLCNIAVNYGLNNNVKVLIDYRDLWPDVFVEIVPKIIQPIIKTLLVPLFQKRKYILKNSTGIISLTNELLDHCLKISSRKKNKFDNIFPLGYLKSDYSKSKSSVKLFWDKLISPKHTKIISFFGTLGYQFDFETIIKTAKKIEGTELLIVICGDGDLSKSLRERSKNSNNIIFPGYMSAEQINELLNRSHIGLCPYIPKKAFLDSIPGKAIEYFSSGLPILTTLGGGVLGNLVEKENFGLNYEYKNSESMLINIRKLLSKLDNREIDNNFILNYYYKNFDSKTVYKNYLNHLEKLERAQL